MISSENVRTDVFFVALGHCCCSCLFGGPSYEKVSPVISPPVCVLCACVLCTCVLLDACVQACMWARMVPAIAHMRCDHHHIIIIIVVIVIIIIMVMHGRRAVVRAACLDQRFGVSWVERQLRK